MNKNRILSSYLSPYLGQPRQTWVILLALFLDSLSMAIPITFTMYLTKEQALPIASVGIIMFCNGLGSALGGYLGGHFSDKFEPRKIIPSTMLISALSLLSLTFTENIISLAIAMFFVGAGAYSTASSSRTALFNQADEKKEIGSALLNASVNAGTILGIALCASLIAINYNLVLIASAMSSACAAAIIYANMTDSKISLASKDNLTQAAPCFFKDPQIILLFFSLLFFCILYGQVFGPYTVFLTQQMGYSESQCTSLFIVNSALVVFFAPQMIKMIDGKSPRLVCIVGTAFALAGILISPMLTSLYLAVLSFFLWTVGEILFMSIMPVMLFDGAKKEERGAVMGMFSAITCLGFALAHLAGDYIYGYFGSDILWIFCFILAFLSAGCLFFLRDVR